MAKLKAHEGLHFIGPRDLSLVEAHPEDTPLVSLTSEARWFIGLLTIFPNFLFLAAIITGAPLFAVFGVLSVALITGIVIDRALRNSVLDRAARTLWITSFFIAGPFAVPLYWWNYIRVPVEEKTPNPTAEGLIVS